MAAAKSRKTRLPSVPGGASKCLRYAQTCSQADGSQFCQDRGATVCGSVTGVNAWSSKPGWLLSAAAGPKSQPVLNERLSPRSMLACQGERIGPAQGIATIDRKSVV